MAVNTFVGTLRPLCKGSIHEMACFTEIRIILSIIVRLISQTCNNQQEYKDNSKDSNYIFYFSQGDILPYTFPCLLSCSVGILNLYSNILHPECVPCQFCILNIIPGNCQLFFRFSSLFFCFLRFCNKFF